MKNNVDEKFLEYCYLYWDVFFMFSWWIFKYDIFFFVRENSDDIYGEREVYM